MTCRRAIRLASFATAIAGFSVCSVASTEMNPQPDPITVGTDAYAHGRYDIALRLLSEPAKQGNPAAETIIGLMNLHGAGVPQNVTEANRLLQLAADKHFGRAENALAFNYEHGAGFPPDIHQALALYRRAVDDGNADAANNLAILDFYGLQIPKNPTEAVHYWQIAADKGSAVAMRNLATISWYGIVGAADKPQAIVWAKKASDAGDVRAGTMLGEMEIVQGDASVGAADVVALWQRSASQGDPRALYDLGILYESGHGVDKDQKKAEQYYADSAARGFVPAIERAASRLWNGADGATADKAKAIDLFMRAAKLGSVKAMEWLGAAYAVGEGVPHDPVAAISWDSLAASHGSTLAKSNIGALYMSQRDYPLAFKWTLEAAQAGLVSAQSSVGNMYLRGIGTPQDDKQAETWLRQAAQSGYVSAEVSLGVLYSKGVAGGAPDYAQGDDWYRKAAEQGSASAEFDLGEAYIFGHGVAQDFNQAAVWTTKAASQGLPYAMNDLGEMYLIGKGEPQDPAQAVTWFEKSASYGIANAMESLTGIYNRGVGVARDPEQALYWATLAEHYSSTANPRLAAVRAAAAQLTAELSDRQKESVQEKVDAFAPKPLPANLLTEDNVIASPQKAPDAGQSAVSIPNAVQ